MSAILALPDPSDQVVGEVVSHPARGFGDDLDEVFAAVRLFRHRNWEVVVLHLVHPDEERLPEGALIDNQGRPTTDPEDFFADPPGAITTAAGTAIGETKPSGLRAMTEHETESRVRSAVLPMIMRLTPARPTVPSLELPMLFAVPTAVHSVCP